MAGLNKSLTYFRKTKICKNGNKTHTVSKPPTKPLDEKLDTTNFYDGNKIHRVTQIQHKKVINY